MHGVCTTTNALRVTPPEFDHRRSALNREPEYGRLFSDGSPARSSVETSEIPRREISLSERNSLDNGGRIIYFDIARASREEKIQFVDVDTGLDQQSNGGNARCLKKRGSYLYCAIMPLTIRFRDSLISRYLFELRPPRDPSDYNKGGYPSRRRAKSNRRRFAKANARGSTIPFYV